MNELFGYDDVEFGFKGEEIEMNVQVVDDYFIRLSQKVNTYGKPFGVHCISVNKKATPKLIPVHDLCATKQTININWSCVKGTNSFAKT